MYSNETTNPLPLLPEEEIGGSSNVQIVPLRRNPLSVSRLMNAAATMIGQRNHENDPSLPLIETDMINVDKFKVS